MEYYMAIHSISHLTTNLAIEISLKRISLKLFHPKQKSHKEQEKNLANYLRVAALTE